jgi:hypothetical protein
VVINICASAASSSALTIVSTPLFPHLLIGYLNLLHHYHMFVSASFAADVSTHDITYASNIASRFHISPCFMFKNIALIMRCLRHFRSIA